jgi:hypothetical protein
MLDFTDWLVLKFDESGAHFTALRRDRSAKRKTAC